MGEVYRARDTRLGRDVAIKVISRMDPASRRRFEQEARAIAALSHPNILAIHDFDSDGGVAFAVTELLEGETLRDRIDRGHLSSAETCRIGAAIADGLAAAHARSIIHRDLKPSNVFLTRDGQVKILDFGLARVEASADEKTDVKTMPGTVMGTLGYMSPEQRRGETIDARTDIYALGCVLQEMGAPKRIVQRCLETDRNLRYHSARDLAIDLRAATHPRRWEWWMIAATAIVIATIVALVISKRPAATHHEVRSILVIPFENATRDSKVEYLSDGIAEGVIDSLSGLPNLRVVARTTAFRFKGRPVDVDQIRKQLDVDAVLSGRLVSAGNNIVIQADLVDAANGTELWGNRFYEQSANVLDIEQNMVARISEALRGRLTAARVATQNPEAYNLYLQGRFYWNKRNPQAISKARDLFQQAIAADPKFALAYSGLADANNMLGGTYRVLPSEEGFRLARDAAEAALRLNPDLAEAHASLGLIESNTFHWAAAEREFKRALELNPNYTSALLWYSLQQLARGRTAESIALMRSAVQIDPLSAIMVTNLAMRLNVIGRYDEGLANAQKGMDLDSGYQPSYIRAGEAYEALGDRDKAVEMYRRGAAVAGPPGSEEALLVRADTLTGHMAEARKVLRDVEQRAARGEVQQAMVAWAYSAIGDRDAALQWLNRALAAREPTLRDSARTLQLKELRGDPRYEDLLRRLARGF